LNLLDKAVTQEYVSKQLNRFSKGFGAGSGVLRGVLYDVIVSRLPMEVSMKHLVRSFVFCLFVILGFALPARA